MRRSSWFFNAPLADEANKKGVDARMSSASLRRLTGDGVKSGRERAARRWGWRYDVLRCDDDRQYYDYGRLRSTTNTAGRAFGAIYGGSAARTAM